MRIWLGDFILQNEEILFNFSLFHSKNIHKKAKEEVNSFFHNACIKFNICLFLLPTLLNYKLTICSLTILKIHNGFKHIGILICWMKRGKLPSAEIQNWSSILYWMLTNISTGKYNFIVYYSKSEAEKRHRIYQRANYSRKNKRVRQSRNVTMWEAVIKQLKIISMFIFNMGQLMFHW